MTSSSPYALITGGSSGIGKAIAEEFARRKVNLLLVALIDSGLEEVSEDLHNRYCVDVQHLPVDLSLPEGPKLVYEWCVEHAFPVNVLVNNAGFGNLTPFEASNLELLIDMMSVNNRAVVGLTHLFIPLLRQHEEGYIMNMSSFATFRPVPNKSVYGATKGFIYSFSQVLRMELKRSHISVSCICPGGVVADDNSNDFKNKIRYKSKHLTLTAEEVARESVRKMYRGKFRIIPGAMYKVLFFMVMLIPEGLQVFILEQIFTNSDIKPPAAKKAVVRNLKRVSDSDKGVKAKS